MLVTFFVSAQAQAKLTLFDTPRYLPPIEFYGDSGKAFTLKDFKADLLIAMVWSRYCRPCIGDLRGMNTFAKQTAAEGIRVILISPYGEWKTIDERRLFLNKFGATDLVSYLDKKSAFLAGMSITSTPTAILVNRLGEEVGQIAGSVNWDDPRVIKYLVDLKNRIK